MPNIIVPADAGGLPSDTEYRALDVMDRIPTMHEGVMVTGHDFAPHLQRGEVAIVDTQDQSLQFGELFVLRMNMDSPVRLQHLAIVQLLRDDGGLWYGFSMKDVGGLMFEGRRLRYVDGPLRAEFWSEKCLGRIVGVMKPRWEGRS